VNQEIEEFISEKTDKLKVYYRGEVNTIYSHYIPGLEDRDFILDRITDFAKDQALQAGVMETLRQLKMPKSKDKWAKIHDILQNALAVERNFDLGLDYFQTGEERYLRIIEQAEKGDVFITGFEDIDKNLLGGGMIRGEIGAWIGLSGSGKSLALVKNCIANLNKGRKVLYITLEIDRDRVAQRFDSMFTHPLNIGINKLITQKDEVLQALNEYTQDYDDKRRLIIKQFPARTMDVPTLKAYYHQAKMRGFVPDLVIVDYIGEMKDYPGMPTWESRFKIVGDLRGFASQEKICLLTALQPDKRARELIRDGQLIDDDNLADSYGQVRPLDCLWSLNRRQADTECGLARVKVIKHRSGKTRFHFHISIDPNTLWMEQITADTYREIYNKYCAVQNISKDEIELKNKMGWDKKAKKKSQDVDDDPSNPE
jgi:archaellum biogenesis ATPase FlaH